MTLFFRRKLFPLTVLVSVHISLVAVSVIDTVAISHVSVTCQ